MNEDSLGLERLGYADSTMAEMLEQTQWAVDFSWHQIKKISEYIHAFRAGRGAVIFDEGQKDQSLCIIVKGSVDIVKSDHSGEGSVIARLHAPQVLGEMSLIDGEPRSAQARAATDLILFVMTKENFFTLAERAPMLAFRILWTISGLLSRRLRKTSGQLIEYLEKEPVPDGRDGAD